MKTRKNWLALTHMVLLLLCAVFVSCSSDSEEEDVKDSAVTGNAEMVKETSAIVKGYLNIDATFQMLIQDFGIEYSENEDFSYSKNCTASGYESPQFEVTLKDLSPNTKYYYRTYIHQLSGLYVYGKTKNFITSPLVLTFNTSYTKVLIEDNSAFGEFYVYLSTKKDGDFQIVEYNRGEKKETIYNNGIYVEGLLPNTTYYCYIKAVHSYGKSEVFGFNTKSLDLSGTNVEYKYTTQSVTYLDYYGKKKTVEYNGLCTVKIKTNLGNQYKYGAILIENENNIKIYSTATSSPYAFSFYPYDLYGYFDSISFLANLIKNGEATDTDIQEFESLVKESDEFVYGCTVQAFVEIDDEIVPIAEKYNIK